jgi:HlyD family secretion protein
MKRKLKWGGGFLLLISLAGLLFFGVRHLRRVEAAGNLPTAPARRGEFRVIVRCRGELKARRSVQITAPVNVPELRIVWLAPVGSSVEAKEPVIRFDPSSAKQQLDQKEAELKQAQAALDQAVAQAHVALEQNKLDLAAAQHQLERATLEVSKAEVVSALQAEESRVNLGLAEKKLSVQQASVELDRVSNEARVASLTRARDKARDEVELTRYRLSQMELTAPIAGMVTYLSNYSQGWVNAKPFKVGDQVWPGAAVAEIPDLDSLEMEGKIEEIDRGPLSAGQEVQVRIDSLPETPFPAKLAMLSPLTVTAWEWPPTRTFRGFAKLEKSDSRLRPGMNGAMDVVIDRIPNAISVPAKALFTLHGKPVVYVAGNGRYTAQGIEVLARNPDEVAVRGIAEGARVALIEPEQKERRE